MTKVDAWHPSPERREQLRAEMREAAANTPKGKEHYVSLTLEELWWLLDLADRHEKVGRWRGQQSDN